MNLNAKIILKIRNFFRKHGRLILIILVVWLIIFLVNLYLKLRPEELELKSSYTPDNPIMDEGDDVPKRMVKSVNETIDSYFNYCNQKQYQSAFDMLTDECKKYLYENDIEQFKEYVDRIFDKDKIYNIQNYSNLNDIYVYNLKILDDITATGTTNDYEEYKEKIAIHNDNNTLKISNQGYIGEEYINREVESDNMKVKVIKKDISYSREEYTLQIQNKTDSFMLLMNDRGDQQVALDLGTQQRTALIVTGTNMVILPGETNIVTFLFDKYFDSELSPQAIKFNNVRLLTDLSSVDADDENQMNITKAFSLDINLK